LPVCLPVVFFSPASKKKKKVGGQSRLEQLQETHHSRTFSFGCCAAAGMEKEKKRGLGRLLSIGRSRDCLCVFSSFYFLNGWQRWKFGIDTFTG
jgi:hypothetical protein